MKKRLMLLGAVLSANAMGASVDAIMNYTPSYLGNPAQNATTDVDGAFYNPAGLTALEEGVHMHLGVQAAKVGFEMTDKRLANPKKYEGKDDLSIVPSFALVKKQGDFAYFMNMGGAAGGPSLKYSDGVPMFNSINSILGGQAAQTLVGGGMSALVPSLAANSTVTGKVEGSNKYYATTLGAAHKINEQWSIAGGIRAILGKRTTEINMDTNLQTGNAMVDPLFANTNSLFTGKLDAEREGFGIGGILGINYTPTEDLRLAATYFSKVDMEFKTKEKRSGLAGVNTLAKQNNALAVLIDGTKADRDLPAQLSLGAEYDITERFRVMTGGSYYFFKDAKIDGTKGFKNGWEGNIGMEYDVTPKWTLTAGYNHAETGAEAQTFNDTEFALDSDIYAVGAKYKQNDDLEWTLGTSFINYDSKESKGIKYDKNITAVGAGVTYKF